MDVYPFSFDDPPEGSIRVWLRVAMGSSPLKTFEFTDIPADGSKTVKDTASDLGQRVDNYVKTISNPKYVENYNE